VKGANDIVNFSKCGGKVTRSADEDGEPFFFKLLMSVLLNLAQSANF
jgi:hypothetical protein